MWEQKDPVLIVQLLLQKHCNCLCMLIWFSFGHLGQWFIAGIVKYFVHCHVFVQSLPGQRSIVKYPVNTFNVPDLHKNVSLSNIC